MAEKKRFYLTTAIAYTSGKPHIGNTYESRSGRQYRALTRDSRDTMYASRQERTSTVRRSSLRQRKQELHRRSS